MGFDCRDKLVLVTGASSGIGRAAAVEFARRGARLALTGRDRKALEATAGSIAAAGGRAEVFPFDLDDLDGIPGLVAEVERRSGRGVDVLVNAAGMAVLGLVADVPTGAFEECLRVNFLAPAALIRAAVPGMRARRSGQVINVSSGVARRGLPGVSAYCASKSALDSLTESLRVELSLDGVDVISVSPGPVDTEFIRRAQVHGRYRDPFSTPGGIPPESVARAVADASRDRSREVSLSTRARLARHLNLWAPSLLDFLLRRAMRRGLGE